MVVGPGLVSTSAAFMKSIASHPAGPHGRLAQKTVIGHPLLGAGGVDTICTGFVYYCNVETHALSIIVNFFQLFNNMYSLTNAIQSSLTFHHISLDLDVHYIYLIGDVLDLYSSS